MAQYRELERNHNETILEFSARFLKAYESIPETFKPSLGLAMMDYSGSFEGEMVTVLRERKPRDLSTMMKNAMEVEANVLAGKKHKHEARRVKEESQASTSTSTDAKFDMVLERMNLMLDRLAIDNRRPPREHNEPQVRNPDFRRPPMQQNRLRENRNPDDNIQAIRAPFAENYVEGETEEGNQDEIPCLNSEELFAYMKKEEYEDLIAQNRADEDLVARSVENPHLVA